jgi:hypothetical protein
VFRRVGKKLTGDDGINFKIWVEGSSVTCRKPTTSFHVACEDDQKIEGVDYGPHHQAAIGGTACKFHCTTNPLPLANSEHLRFEARLSDNKLSNDLKRLGFELRLLSRSTRLDPWATTEIIRVGNSQQLRQHAGIVDICIYEVQLPGIAEPKATVMGFR